MSIYTQHHKYCFSEYITAGKCEKARFEDLTNLLNASLKELQAGKNEGANPLLDIIFDKDDMQEMEGIAANIKARFTHVVVAGAGGSGLSGRVLSALKPASKPSLHFLETIDPDAIDDLLLRIELEKTFFIIISKSGATVETLGQFYMLFELLQKQIGKDANKHFLIITTQGDNPLRESAVSHNIRILNHAADISGRFSAFTYSGMLPAAIASIDIAAIRRGAVSVVEEMRAAKDAASCAPATGAALQYGFMEQGRNISVMLPYSERLAGFSRWYRQSWAESLGKSGKGTTPIRAVGTTDQHSQLQLFLDGPDDKLFQIITIKRANTGHAFNVPIRDDIAYLKNKTTGDIMAAEQKATIETLVKNGCPVRLFTLESLKEEQLGALLMHFTLEIIFMAALLEVNPFDQPAVEESKQFARDYLRTGNL